MFAAIVEHTGISRTTLYRNPNLRAIIDQHRHRSQDPRTITALSTEVAYQRVGLEDRAERIRRQEERIRRLETAHRRKSS